MYSGIPEGKNKHCDFHLSNVRTAENWAPTFTHSLAFVKMNLKYIQLSSILHIVRAMC